MPNIPSTIYSVQVNFDSGVNKQVDQHMIDGLTGVDYGESAPRSTE